MIPPVRVTVDIPEELLQAMRQLARQRKLTVSEMAADLIRRGLEVDAASEQSSGRREIPSLSVGRPITAADVRSLDGT
ncbi:MAG: antitoxin [Acidimicrobiia bacterium]